jgi:enoyl-CoA hydratase/carnithine racemase
MKIEIDHGVLTASFTRSSKLNAMDLAEWRDLAAAMETANDRSDVRVVVLLGDGKAFCAGNDIRQMEACESPDDAERYFVGSVYPAFVAMARSRVPIVARVHGLTIGGGLEIAQFSDVVVTARSASFGLPEARLGVWASVFLAAAPYMRGRSVAGYLALAGQTLSAEDALAAGLVHRVVDDANLDESVRQVVDGIMSGSPRSIECSRREINRDLISVGLPRVREAFETLANQLMFREEYAEGLAAYREHRAPQWPT